MSAMDPTKRFSNRVKDYISYRPGYPEEIVELLKSKYDLSSMDEMADIGAGVGHSTKLFAPHVRYIYAIEPNQKMYNALLEQMKEVSNFSARLQSAENTGLETQSVQFVVCGQSYHWFDHRKAKTEFERILDDHGYVVLMWNSRRKDYPFGKAYEQFLKEYAIDYDKVSHHNLTDDDYDYLLSSWDRHTFDNIQRFDLLSLIGRFTSSSYSPAPDSYDHEIATNVLEKLFGQYEHDGIIEFKYTTEVIVGKI